MPAILVGLGDFASAALAYLSAVCAFILAVAAVWLWLRIMHPVFDTVARILPGGWKVLGQTIIPDLRQAWKNLDAAVYNELIRYRDDSELAVAFTWHWMAEAWRWNAGMVEWLAKETDATFDALAHIHVPKWAKWATFAALPPLLLAKIVKAVLPHIHVATRPITQYITKAFPRTIVHLSAKAIAAAFPGIRDIPWIEREVYGLTKRNLRHAWRLRRLEGLLTVTGLAVVMAKVFGLPNWRCLTRGNVGRAMRGLCRAPTWLLDVFLLASFEAFAILDLCQLVSAEVKLAEWFQPLLMDFVDVDEWLIKNCGYAAPPPLSVAPLRLPAGKYGFTLNEERDYTLGLAA